MASINVKVGGTWRSARPWVKVSGTWQGVKSGWVKVSGVWQQFYQRPLYNGTLTVADSGFGSYGFSSGFYGSVSPSNLTDGMSIYSAADAGSDSSFSVSGFGGDPGANYCSSVTINGVSRSTSLAVYGYGGGVAQWLWVGQVFGLSSLVGSNTPVIVMP